MDDQNEQTYDESLAIVIASLPPPIRRVFQGDTIPKISRELYAKYQLHVDQGAILEREIIQLLLGVKDPTEFVETLENEAHLPKEKVVAIANDVNDRVFVPLREELRKGEPAKAPTPPAPSYGAWQPPKAPSPPVPSTPVPPPAPRPDVPRPSTLRPDLPALPEIPAAPALMDGMSADRAPLPPRAVLPKRPPAPPVPRAPGASAILPPPPPTARVAPRPAPPPPPNLPGALPEVPAAPKAPPVHGSSYATDPYREPLDES